jgi:ubiquinone/menaquinone biosynthesis C-methylase UbiE
VRGFYARVIFPWVLELSVGGAAFAKERANALNPAHREVLEVGFGTGLNLSHYPRSVTRLVGLDPEEMLPVRISQRIAAAGFPVERVLQAGEHLPFAAGKFDCVVTTLTLCTIADPVSALSEIRRVLRVGGTYLFLEHGRSADARVAAASGPLESVVVALRDGPRVQHKPPDRCTYCSRRPADHVT